jgi:large subunit ribosomal protein L9
MQVILKQNVPTLGKKGDVKNVKDGYYLNYLLPRKLAELATPERLKTAEHYRKREVVQHERIKEQSAELKEKIDKLKIVLKAKAKGDKLYGSITENEILKAIEEKLNVRLDKQHLLLSEHIKVVGTYEVPVRLVEGVEAKFILEVKPEK